MWDQLFILILNASVWKIFYEKWQEVGKILSIEGYYRIVASYNIVLI